MLYNSETVRKEVVKLVPASLLNDVACFVLHDNYPRDQKDFDITVCTKNAEVIEFYQRNKMSSVTLNCETTPDRIVLFRNSIGKIFYLVSAGNVLFVIKRNNALTLHKTVRDVFRYEITDTNCSGFVNLKVVLNCDAIPIIYDDNFECLSDGDNWNQSRREDTSPISLQLQRKLREVKYTLKYNEKALNDLITLRQRVAFSQYQKQCSNLKDTVFTSVDEVATILKIKTQVPVVRSCNQKIVILFQMLNENNVSLEEVNVLLTNSSQSLVYTTKIFEKINKPPFWTESLIQRINPDTETAIVSVINIEEFKKNVLSKIVFKGIICYKKEGKDCLLPFDDVAISSTDTMGEDFDVLASKKYDKNTMLAILASTVKLDLSLRHILNEEVNPRVLELPEIFCTYLQMDMVFSNIVIHRKSPYHILNGLMIVYKDDANFGNSEATLVSVYARTSSQILALLHHIYDSVPFRIIVTVPSYELTARGDSLSAHPTDKRVTNHRYSGSKKIGMILEFINSYMTEMSEIKDPVSDVDNRLFSKIN